MCSNRFFLPHPLIMNWCSSMSHPIYSIKNASDTYQFIFTWATSNTILVIMEVNPFYTSPVKEADRPVRYRGDSNTEKLNILEAAKKIGIRKAAKLFKVSRSNIRRGIKHLRSFRKWLLTLIIWKRFSPLCPFINKSTTSSYMNMTLDTDCKGKNLWLCPFMSLQLGPTIKKDIFFIEDPNTKDS